MFLHQTHHLFPRGVRNAAAWLNENKEDKLTNMVDSMRRRLQTLVRLKAKAGANAAGAGTGAGAPPTPRGAAAT